jgi:uncharacterized protein (TIGR03643 family)
MNDKALLTTADQSRLIEMAWEDRTPFDAIQKAFGLNEGEVVDLMRVQLKANSFKLWRQRMRGRVTKHSELRVSELNNGQKHRARHRIPQR